jgi:hypothetical protein
MTTKSHPVYGAPADRASLHGRDLLGPAERRDATWEQLHTHFTEPELVEFGSLAGYVAGGQRWIRTVGIGRGEVLAETTVGLSPVAAAQLRNQNAGREG